MLSATVRAADRQVDSPQAGARSHAQNFKDMVLASCLARAYGNEPGAATDAGSSVSALRDWTYFDMEKSPEAVEALVDEFLARDYTNPLAEAEVKGIRFDFLKCMDLYHSKALDKLVKRLVIHPQRSYRQESRARR
ncbi:type VI secretion system amidase immunity protein Tai4 [Oxalobacteraceae bacterium OTU3CINTB1]|nr:type VI secretion system amidase immunity protein Tai4 [Oxalobacteraceae bacterium OTU3CINTB1]